MIVPFYFVIGDKKICINVKMLLIVIPFSFKKGIFTI